MYPWFYRNILSRTDAEFAHRFGVVAFKYGGPFFRLGRSLGVLARRPVAASLEVGGVKFPGPVGLAAGMDKNAEAITGLIDGGFGFVEVGTVTPKGQPGNEKPRMWREKDLHAFRNRMGFNNAGADEMAERLRKLRSSNKGKTAVVGVNIGKNKLTSPEDAAADYHYCAQTLTEFADYLVINVSSPNTPGLRDLQAVESLRPILQATVDAATVPVFVKIAPDLADHDVDAVVDLAQELGLAGIVATNTTIAHDRGDGGLSGAPLLPRALEVVTRIKQRSGDGLAIIGVGGISSIADAEQMIAAGADLVQVYTAFVYNGPGWVSRMNASLRRDA